VIGSKSDDGHERLGVDVEAVISIDNDALRIAPLIEAGFHRACLAYGPFRSKPGLAFAVYILNGHNTSQAESIPETLRRRWNIWLRGPHNAGRLSRAIRWVLGGRWQRTLRLFRWWKRTAINRPPVPPLNENLAVGWYPEPAVQDPRTAGSGFIMHALGPENGELWAGCPDHRTRALRGVQNVPLYLVEVIRGSGVVYYVSSVGGAVGPTPYPWMRPIALESTNPPEELYVGIQQSVLGQIGWRIDTRVHGVRAAILEGFDSWFGGAHAADSLDVVPIEGAQTECGGEWRILTIEAQQGYLAVLDPGEPSGLIHAVVPASQTSTQTAGLTWRCVDAANHWNFELRGVECVLSGRFDGEQEVVRSWTVPPATGLDRRLQVLDDGYRMRFFVDGEPLSDASVEDDRLNHGTGVGVLTQYENGDHRLCRFEAHPLRVRLPDVFDMGAPWDRAGTQEIATDDFAGEPADLEGRRTSTGDLTWRRIMGQGTIELDGEGSARVRGSVDAPCPDRTMYCLDWPHEDFVDIEVTITPPGTAAGEKQRGTSGLVLYQDPQHFMILNMWRSDFYAGGSLSTFFRFGRFEDIYDAVWTNVGQRIDYGKATRLRLRCDGDQYLASLDDETVLFRAFRDVYPEVASLRIRKVGLVANWEFGTDTGSRFERVRLRT
jgi:hypothetical protein